MIGGGERSDAVDQLVNYCLAALGKAGAFTVEVLRRSDGGWMLSIESPAWCFVFELTGPGTVSELAAFLQTRAGRAEFAELAVGSFGGAVVRIIQDDEFMDRLFLRTTGEGALVDFTLTGGAVNEFTTAVREAAAEFDA